MVLLNIFLLKGTVRKTITYVTIVQSNTRQRYMKHSHNYVNRRKFNNHQLSDRLSPSIFSNNQDETKSVTNQFESK